MIYAMPGSVVLADDVRVFTEEEVNAGRVLMGLSAEACTALFKGCELTKAKVKKPILPRKHKPVEQELPRLAEQAHHDEQVREMTDMAGDNMLHTEDQQHVA